MKQTKSADEMKERSADKSAIASKEPLTEGKAGLTRRKMLFATMAGSLSALGAVVLGSAKCEAPYKLEGVPEKDGSVEDAGPDSGDASRLDAEVKDVNVPPDVHQLDARADAQAHDSSVPDSAVDSSMPDAMVPDSGIDSGVDSAVDASGPTCSGAFNESAYGMISGSSTLAVGGYLLRYESNIDTNNITLEVKCAADQSVVLSGEQFTRSVQKTVSLGDKNLTVTINWMNSTSATVTAETTDP